MLNKNGDFRRLYHRGTTVADPALVIYYMKNHAGICRIGITTGKKIGNAVVRNRCRRMGAFEASCTHLFHTDHNVQCKDCRSCKVSDEGFYSTESKGSSPNNENDSYSY